MKNDSFEVYLIDGEPYPTTIVQDRYSGSYSGAKWLAFNLDEWAIPNEISSDDLTCMSYWSKENKMPIGKGKNPNEAYLKNQR
jgi:hypothetical protein